MKRTTINLPDDLAALLEMERRRRDVSAATIVREALATYFGQDGQPKRFSFIGIGRSGRSDISENIEEILTRDARSREGYNRMMYGDRSGPTVEQLEAMAALSSQDLPEDDADRDTHDAA